MEARCDLQPALVSQRDRTIEHRLRDVAECHVVSEAREEQTGVSAARCHVEHFGGLRKRDVLKRGANVIDFFEDVPLAISIALPGELFLRRALHFVQVHVLNLRNTKAKLNIVDLSPRPRLNRAPMNKVKPIPDGYDSLIPVLTVRGGASAIDWYKKLFGATEKFRMPLPNDPQKIAHAEIVVYGRVLMLNEENPQWGTQSPQSIQGSSPVAVMIYVENVDALFAKAQSLGAKPIMPPMDMFWGDRFGKFIDPFGHQWAIATHIKDMTPEEMAKDAEEAFKKGC